jgi:hypothetical protein
MKADMTEMEVNGVTYVRKDSIEKHEQAEQLDGMEYCIVRTYSAGVFAGYVKKRKGKEGELISSRRIWYWDGACSLSQLAMEGTNNPSNCKFAVEVPVIRLTEIIEEIPCTEKARINIQEVPEWKK